MYRMTTRNAVAAKTASALLIIATLTASNCAVAQFYVYEDFNLDGSVDGYDFLAWQRGESWDPMSQNDLTSWEVNYGVQYVPLASAAVVPEPSTWIILLLGVIALNLYHYLPHR